MDIRLILWHHVTLKGRDDMPKISVIGPRRPRLKRKKKVAAYTRVSMETEMLLHSLSAQVSYYNDLIQRNPEWEFAGIYADEGISGTSTAHRDDFNRLVADCEAGKIDMVLVKSISRFARDTVDTLETTRHLKELGIDVYFERENIHSISDEGELLLTLLASFAQEESRSISENVKWGIRKRFEQGIPNGHKAPYGYEWDGEMYRAIPEQGKIVKEIFEKYLAGASAYGIAKELSARGITGQKGVPMDDSAVKFILANWSYTGTMLLQKNFISEGHTRKRNKGELPMYMVEGMFEPLIAQEDFEKAQRIRKGRADACANRNPALTAFSGLVRCGECGCSASRRTTKYGKKWNCNTRERKGKAQCGLRPVYEAELEQAAATALRLDAFDGEAVRREVGRITINQDSIGFHMKNGQERKVMREYRKGHSAFSQKVTCGCCGKKLGCDYWKTGPAGQKEKRKVWVCRGCSFRRLPDDELREAVAGVLGREDYEPRFVKEVAGVTAFADRLEFHFTEGRVAEWPRK